MVSPQCRETLCALAALGATYRADRRIHARVLAAALSVPEGSIRGRLKTLAGHGLVDVRRERFWPNGLPCQPYQAWQATDRGERIANEWREFPQVATGGA